MSQDKELTYKRLAELWGEAKVKTLKSQGEKYAIMSDLHLGDGGKADDLCGNKDTLKRALTHYRDNGYTLLLLGDIEELWQFEIYQIDKEYGNEIYLLLRSFGINRIHRVYGNHDLDWCLKDPIRKDQSEQGWAVEALKMTDKAGKPAILLVHGHQGNIESDRNAWFSRIFVRRIWTPIEPWAKKLLGIEAPKEAPRAPIAKNYEQVVYSWAKKQKVVVMCGHSHRAIYASMSCIDIKRAEIRELEEDIAKGPRAAASIEQGKDEIKKLQSKIKKERKLGREIDPVEPDKRPLPCYFNCGCGIYSDGMTALEIADDKIRLVKWHKNPKKDEPFEVYEDGDGKTLTDFISETRQ